MNDLPVIDIHCPVCGGFWVVPFFDGGEAPLAAMGWPRSAAAAQAMPRYPLDFVRCLGCGHIWNRSFRDGDVPYKEHANLMFNSGTLWQKHLQTVITATVAHLPEHPTVVEIGCGSGHFLQALAQRRPGRYFGFDPNSSVVHNSGFQFEARFFEPLTDIPQLQPDLIVMRHVLEHFSRPAAFLERLLLGAQQCSHSVLLLIEVPCVDRLLESIRLADFFYEHPQQFTTSSFTAILQRVGAVQCLERAYWDEVIWGLVQLRRVPVLQEHWRQTATWRDRCQEARAAVAQQLQALVAAGKKVAIWGGTGKAAAFMHHYGVDAERFPLVVDSDPAKVGTHVPGTGQLIQFRDVLKTQPVDVIIIPSQWRVRDIWLEMEREGIAAAVVLTECNGRLVDASALLAGVRAPN